MSVTEKRLVESYAADFLHGVSKGKVVTAKHFAVATGLHNITGSKEIVQITHNLGHSISYPLTCDILTGQAQVVQECQSKNNILPLQPKSAGDVLLTWFWVDNNDAVVERPEGGGAINTTHMMAFQEAEFTAVNHQDTNINIPRSTSREIRMKVDNECFIHVEKKPEPPSLLIGKARDTFYCTSKSTINLFIWCCLRNFYSDDQVVPSFSGWLLQHRSKESTQKPVKTVETYLPPITTKVTDYKTIDKYMKYLKEIAKSVNMPYVNILSTWVLQSTHLNICGRSTQNSPMS